MAFFLWTTGATTAALASPGCNCGPHGAGAGSFLQRVGDTVSAEHTGAQQRRPRDCTCITGMKTYPTTPRDELKAMGPVGLRQKAKDLKADEKSLKVQKKEQVKENAEMVEKAEAAVEKEEGEYEDIVKDNEDERADTREEHQAAREEVKKLTDELRTAKNDAATEKNKFTKLTADLNGAMLDMAVCQCQEDAAVASSSAALLQEKGKGSAKSRNKPQEAEVHKLVREVEDLEQKNLDLMKDLQEDAEETAKELSSADSKKEMVKIREKEAMTLHSKMSKAKMLEAAEKQVKILTKLVASQEGLKKSVAERCGKLETKTNELKEELQKCGCGPGAPPPKPKPKPKPDLGGKVKEHLQNAHETLRDGKKSETAGEKEQ